MDNLPANVATGGAVVPQRKTALAGLKQGTMKALGKVRTEAGEAIHAAGVSVERIHRRVILVVAALLAMLVVGAFFRSIDLLWVNYVLIGLFGLAALYAFLQPAHLAGALLVGGGVALANKDMGAAGSALLGYAKVLGRVFLAFLIPLLLFALAPGDRSLGSSLPFIVLAPVVVLAMWLFGRVAPKLEKFVFVALPLAALLIAVTNMLIPERMLATLGVPAWLRTARPQDDELARLETAIEKRKNELRATQLRAIRAKVEAGQPLTAEDEALVADAKNERLTLTGWIDGQLKGLAKLGAVGEAKPVAAPAVPPGGMVTIPAKGWSKSVAVPKGYKLCFTANVRSQCHPAGKAEGLWYDSGRCASVTADAMRFRSRKGKMELDYGFVAAGANCPAR
jgi:hypothetical protein